MVGDQRIVEHLEIAVEDLREGVHGEADAMVGDTVLLEVVGTYLLGALPGANLGAARRRLFALLRPEAIGVSLTDSAQMVPEQSVSAFVVHHPAAKYFAV